MSDGLYATSTLVCDGVECAVALAIVLVVGRIVRRQRPDAYRPLLAWSVGALIAVTSSAVAYRVVAGTSWDARPGGLLSALAAIALGRAAASIVLALAFVRGIVVLAQPPKPLSVESDAPYR